MQIIYSEQICKPFYEKPPRIFCFWLREDWQVPTIGQSLYQTDMSYKKTASKKLAVFTGKHLSLLRQGWNKAAGHKTCNFITKRLQHRCFPVSISTFLITPVLNNICVLLLPKVTIIKNLLENPPVTMITWYIWAVK